MKWEHDSVRRQRAERHSMQTPVANPLSVYQVSWGSIFGGTFVAALIVLPIWLLAW